MEGREEAARGEHEGSLRQESPPVVHPVQVSAGHVSHADRSSRTVQELITIPVTVTYSTRGETGGSEWFVKLQEGPGELTRVRSGKALQSPDESSLSRAEAESDQTHPIYRIIRMFN